MPFVSKRSLFIGPSSYSARRAAANGGEVSMKCDLNVDSWTEVQCYYRNNKRVKSRYGLVSAYVRYWPKADIWTAIIPLGPTFTPRGPVSKSLVTAFCFGPNRKKIGKDSQMLSIRKTWLGL